LKLRKRANIVYNPHLLYFLDPLSKQSTWANLDEPALKVQRNLGDWTHIYIDPPCDPNNSELKT